MYGVVGSCVVCLSGPGLELPPEGVSVDPAVPEASVGEELRRIKRCLSSASSSLSSSSSAPKASARSGFTGRELLWMDEAREWNDGGGEFGIGGLDVGLVGVGVSSWWSSSSSAWALT